MLRSSNPILSKKDAFTPAAPQYGQPYGQQPYQGYPGQGGFGGPQDPRANAPQTVQGRMTLDDVITKTALVMGLLVVSAALAWMLIPDALYMPALILSSLVGFGTVLLVSFRRNVSPALVLAYAAIEGVFIGMISKVFESLYPGIVAQAVVATFFAAGATLAAGGKRLRPLLVLLCAGPEGSERAARRAASIELVHVATLVHDDVLGPVRRGPHVRALLDELVLEQERDDVRLADLVLLGVAPQLPVPDELFTLDEHAGRHRLAAQPLLQDVEALHPAVPQNEQLAVDRALEAKRLDEVREGP